MNRAVILHGKPTEERYNWALEGLELMPHDANWLPWLDEQLTTQGIQVERPALPRPFSPDYEAWKDTFEYAGGTNRNTALVGHSAGAEFILRYLSEEHDATAEQIILVAPYHDWDGKYGDFSEYKLDASIAERVGRIAAVYSDDDDQPILSNVVRLREDLPTAHFTKLYRYGHFRIGHNLLSPEVPELLEIVTRSN